MQKTRYASSYQRPTERQPVTGKTPLFCSRITKSAGFFRVSLFAKRSRLRTPSGGKVAITIKDSAYFKKSRQQQKGDAEFNIVRVERVWMFKT